MTRILTALLILATSLSSFSKNKPKLGDSNFPSPSPSARHNAKVLAIKNNHYDLLLIGDSITHTVGEFGGKYKPFKSVWEKYYAPHNAINLGYNGYRTEQILWNLQNGELDFKASPKVAMILIGMLFVFGSNRSATLGRKIFFGVAIALAFEMFARLSNAFAIGFDVNPILISTLPTLIVMLISFGILSRKSIQ